MKLDQNIPLAGQKGTKVLVVDDSRMQRRILKSLLTRMGHLVVEVETAMEALKICQETDVSIVVSDWMMPEMTGLEFCQSLRALDLDRYVYFILLTSKSNKDDIAQGLDTGADDFLTKPVNGGELRARITAGQRILSMEQTLLQKNQEIELALTELRSLYDALDKDLVEARKLQHSLIPEREKSFCQADVKLFLQSSGRVGGDLVGWYPISDDRIGLFSIDVSGHGVASALMTARLAGYLSAAVPDQNIALRKSDKGYEPVPPSEVVCELNSLVLSEIETEHYFTICLADVDLATGLVTFCQAGHPHPLVRRANGSTEYVGEGGLPVGLIDGATYDETQITLFPGDSLFIYSDGISECEAPNGEMLDDAGLVRVFGDPRNAFFENLLARLRDYAGSDDFNDDISGVLLNFNT